MAARPALIGAGGAVVGVGRATSDGLPLMRRARDGATETLGELPFAAGDLWLTGATPDASVIVGFSFPEHQSFIFRDGEGLTLGLEGLPDTADGAGIVALSRDGSTFAGITFIGNDRVSVFRWTQASGVVEIGDAITSNTPGADPFRMALSDDGSVLVFSGDTGGSEEFAGYRWTQAAGAQPLAPGVQSTAWLTSGDGRVAIGRGSDGGDYGAFIWTEASGARSLRSTLESAGVDLRGWTIDVPWSLSRDGRIATGVGRCGDISTVYRMVLPE
jgi:hypothetical protein